MDHLIRSISRLSLAMAVALTVGCEGPAGPAGPAGTNGTNGTNGATGPTGAAGTNGTNGAPCTVTAYDGGVTVSCPGSNPVDVPNGTDGASCTVANIDGGVTVSCPGSSPVTVLNGNNGTNGNNGQTGLGLSSGLKVSVTSVSSTNPVTVRFRVMDDRNNPVDLNGNYSINTPFVPRFALAYIPTTDAGVVLPYKVYTKTGSATAALTTDPAPDPATVVVQPTAVSPTFPIPTGGVPATDAAMKGLLVENGTGMGDYTYTFPTGGNTQIRSTSGSSNGKFVTSVTAPNTYDSTKLGVTHTLWIQIARQTDIQNPSTVQGLTPLDVEYNFIPNGVGTPTKREIVTTAACSKCHNGFKRDLNPNLTLATVNGFHGGGRVESPFCNVCHNPDRVSNPAANSSVFVHRLHGAHSLVANPDGGIPVDAFHAIQVGYPQDIRNCDACHAGAQNGAQATTNPTLAACGSCHNGVDFATGSTLPTCTNPAARDADHRFIPCKHQGGAQANSALCASCHGGPASLKPLALSHLTVIPPDPLAAQILPDAGFGNPDGGAGFNIRTNAAYLAAAGAVPPDAAKTTYDLKSVSVNSAGHPVAEFRLLQSINGAAATPVDFGTYDATTKPELITNFVGGPSIYFAFSVPQDGIAAPADYNASASCWVRNAWRAVSPNCTLTKDATTGYYTLEIVNVNIPSSVKMLTGGVGYTYDIPGARPLTQINLAAYPYNATTGIGGLIVPAPNVSKTGTNFAARRPIVDNARCNNCHVMLGAAPSFHVAQRNDGPTCSFCHTPNRTSSAWAANSKDFIHAIHAGRIRTVPFNWHALSESENFSEVEFPSNINNCEACHAKGTYDFTLASTVNAYPNMLMSTVATGKFNNDPVTNPTGWFSISPYVVADNVFDYGAGFGFSTSTGVITPAAGTTLVKSPIVAACSACHDANQSIAHMKAMGGSFYEPRSVASGKYEQCLICHGPGTIAAITNMHK